MSLTVDYITMPPKSQEVSQIQQTDTVKHEGEQQQIVAGFEQNAQKEMKTTIARRKANNDGLKNDEKGGGKGKYKKQNKKGADDKGKEQEKKLNPVEGGLFDIKI